VTFSLCRPCYPATNMEENISKPGQPGRPAEAGSPSWVGRLSRIRHDLRNPLGEILGFSEILQEEAVERGLQPLLSGFEAIHQAAARVFAEVNHWLSPDTIGQSPESFQELERTIQLLTDRIIATAESLSEKCDALENNWGGDDLLRIIGAARRLRDDSPTMLHELATAYASGSGSQGVGTGEKAGLDTSIQAKRLHGGEIEPVRASGSLLIVDDNEANRALLARRLRRQGYTVSLAENGRQALEKLRARRFDLVLLDVIMPEMGGYHVLEKMKQDPLLRHVPVIMISALDDLEMLARCIEKGAEDYLSKPFDAVLLQARIGSSLEKKRLHDHEEQTYRALVESQKHLAAELAEAAAYVKSLLPAPLQGEVTTDWRYVPSSELGGDAFGYRWVDADHFAIFLLDVCSHGVGAALLSISVMNVLRSQNLPGADFCDPSTVLAALNRAFAMESQNNLYFTMWYGVLEKSTRRLRYSSGGHPPAILITGPDRAEAKVEKLKTSGPPIGTFPESVYPVQSTSLQSFNRLFVFSDGAYEIVRQDGSMLTLEEFIQHLVARLGGGTDALPATLSYLEKARGLTNFEDDLALVEFSLT
jgi:sigma-B regulation protein RsbU (phosphoserine phosphatase)